jgi:hypothetical protein
MKKLLPLFLLSFILMSCVTSKRVAFLSTANLNKPDTLNLAEYEKKYGDYDIVYLNIEQTYEHTGTKNNLGMYSSNYWYFNVVNRSKYLVLNPDNEKYTTFSITLWEGAKIGNFFLKITSPEGKVKVYGKDDCKKETDSDNLTTYKFIYPDVRKGSIIEEGMEYSYDGFRGFAPLKHEIPLQFKVPCEKYTFNYSYPDWWQVKRKKTSPTDTVTLQTVEDNDNHKKTFSYSATNIPAVEEEAYSPFYKEMANYLEFMVASFKMSSLNYKSASNWSELGDSYKDYAMNKDGFLSSMVSDTTEYLIKDCKTDYEKVDKIISYIQENIEVDSKYDDKSFKKILIKRKGDILSINGLAQSMLTKAGFKCDYLMIHTASEGYFDKDYISRSQFTIPAVRTWIDNKEYILLPYLEYLPMGFLPEDLQGQTILVINNNSPAKLEDIGDVKLNDDTFEEKYNLTINDDGIINVNEEKWITGLFAYYLREKLETASKEDKDNFVIEVISYNEGNVNLSDYELLNEKDYKKPLIIKLKYSIDNLVTITPEEIILQTAGLFTPSPLEKKKFEEDKRHNPIRIYNNLVYSKEISIAYPPEWKIQTKLNDVDYKNEFGEVESRFDLSDGKIKAEQQQYLKKSSEPKEKFNELKEILGSNSKISIPAIVFEVGQSTD